ncbi:MAG: hypothetical protein HYY79_08465 [Betaproteobacteria bacterium]|nr:hypothetical protein [Betaproteobacteria bacterium]
MCSRATRWLPPLTEFRVDDYRYEGRTDGTEKGFFSLLKGGLRTITGAIGRTNRPTYQVSTVTATIGIRGTEYLARIVNSLEVHVGEGSLFLTNNAGKFAVDAGTSVFIADQNSRPVILQAPPVLGPAAQQQQQQQQQQEQAQQQAQPLQDQPVFVVGNQTTSTGSASIVGGVTAPFTILTPGPGYALAFSIGGESNILPGGFCQIGCINSTAGSQCGRPEVTVTTTGVSHAPQGPFYSGDFIDLGSTGADPLSGTATFKGGTPAGVSTFGWGYFTNGTVNSPTGSIMFGPNEGFHVVMGIPTPAMPTSGSATYNMISGGFTTPTFSDNVGAGLGTGTITSGTLNASFLSNVVNTNFNASFSSGNAYTFSGSGGISGAGFTGSASFFRTSGTSTACATTCSALFNGFFSGTNTGSPAAPPFAGYVYKVSVPGSPGFGINGAIGFQR